MFSGGFTLPKLRSRICCLAPGGIPVCCAHRGTWMVLVGGWVSGGRGGSDKKKQKFKKNPRQCRFAFKKKKDLMLMPYQKMNIYFNRFDHSQHLH